MPPTPHLSVLRLLARTFLAGEPDPQQIVTRAEHLLGRPWPWLAPLVQRYLQSLASRHRAGVPQCRPRHRDVVHFLRNDRSFNQALQKHAHQISVTNWITAPEAMQPATVARAWPLPVIESVAALADWLWLEYSDLDWFADSKGLGYKLPSERLHHYRYCVLPKSSGGVRLIEAPKPRLKKMQREILAGILEHIPPHPAAHGFLKHRSIQTFAAPHIQQPVVLRMDLSDFFVSITGVRIQTLFRLVGYPEAVADLLGAICTNAVPRGLWNDPKLLLDLPSKEAASTLYARPHLPQGAPTSPALANLCAFRIDSRLTGLANAAGADYTRYADDLAFSGGTHFQRSVESFATSVAAILGEEGFSVNHHKTRIMRQAVQQHLAGLVVNQKMNVSRANFDRLKATLTNCIRFGPETQNRALHPFFQAHLQGRIAFFRTINPKRAQHLDALFQQISWPQAS